MVSMRLEIESSVFLLHNFVLVCIYRKKSFYNKKKTKSVYMFLKVQRYFGPIVATYKFRNHPWFSYDMFVQLS